jgi:hypothetical protein
MRLKHFFVFLILHIADSNYHYIPLKQKKTRKQTPGPRPLSALVPALPSSLLPLTLRLPLNPISVADRNSRNTAMHLLSSNSCVTRRYFRRLQCSRVCDGLIGPEHHQHVVRGLPNLCQKRSDACSLSALEPGNERLPCTGGLARHVTQAGHPRPVIVLGCRPSDSRPLEVALVL